MPPRGQDLGTKNPFRLRVGMDVPGFEGINTEQDPAAIRDSQFQHLENVRWKGGRLISRNGLAKVNSGAAMLGSVIGGGSDATLDSPTPLSAGGGGGGSSLVGVGGDVLYRFDPVFGARTVPIVNSSSGSVLWQSAMYFVNAQVNPPVLYAFDPGGNLPPRAVAVFTAMTSSAPYGASLCGNCADGKLYVALTSSDAVNTMSVFSWDGKTVATEEQVAGFGTPIIFAYREGLIYHTGGAPSASDTWRYRNAAGTWASLGGTPGGGFSTVTPVSAAVYKDVAYIAVNTTGATSRRILSYDGSTFTTARTVTGALFSLLSFDGSLLYLWDAGGAQGGDAVGTFDGSTWTDTAKDLSGTSSRLASMIDYQNELHIVGVAGVSAPELVRTTSRAVTGSYTTVLSDTGGFEPACDVHPHLAVL